MTTRMKVLGASAGAALMVAAGFVAAPAALAANASGDAIPALKSTIQLSKKSERLLSRATDNCIMIAGMDEDSANMSRLVRRTLALIASGDTALMAAQDFYTFAQPYVDTEKEAALNDRAVVTVSMASKQRDIMESACDIALGTGDGSPTTD